MPHLVNSYESDCPVNPAHKRSVHFGECSCCGEVVIFCEDGCSEQELLDALGLPGPPSGHTGFQVTPRRDEPE
jgi:hypothetical protein